MAELIKINVNPEVIKWARLESGYLTNEIIEKLKIDEKRYLEWEKTGIDIPYGKLKLLASTFKRQVAVFFLSQVPKSKKKPKDYRNLSVFHSALSKEALFTFRRINKYRELIIQNSEQYLIDRSNKWINEYQTSFSSKNLYDVEITKWLRSKLGFTIEQQLEGGDLSTTFKILRTQMEEKLGIFVFQFKMPIDELQGFSIADEYPYCIVVNKDNYDSSKIFTLLHELGHILNHQSAICYPEQISSKQTLELTINKFVGNFLIPDELIKPLYTREEIFKYSKKIKVSSEAYLRRLHSIKLITDDQFFIILDEIKLNITKRTKGGFAVPPLQKCINTHGQLFFDNIISWVKNERINFRTAADALGIKANHFINSL